MPYMRITNVKLERGMIIPTIVVYEGSPGESDKVIEVYEFGYLEAESSVMKMLQVIRDTYETEVAQRQAAPQAFKDHIGDTLEYVDHNTMLVNGSPVTVPD